MTFRTYSCFGRCLSFLPLLFVLTDSLLANSIYSRRGIGLLRYRDNVRAVGMGGAGIAIGDSISFYFINPAGLTRVNFARLQGDFRYERTSVNLARSTDTGLFSDASVNSLNLAFPVKLGQVVALGVRPYSASSFEFRQTSPDNSVQESLNGSGGVSELYLGYAAKVDGVSFGLITDLYFGRLNRIWRLNYASDSLRNSEDVINHHFTGAGLHLGLQAQFGQWQLGAAAGLPTRLNVKTESSTITGFNEVTSQNKLKLPFWWGAGLSCAPNRHWVLGADWRMQQWSTVKPEELLGDRGVNSYDLSFGGELIPSFDALTGYFKRVSYRLGANFRQLPYEEPAGKKVRQWTVNAGFGLPFGRGYNRIDLAVELGRRGSLTDNLAKENIVLFHAAITGSERWFQRPKRK
jgi:opacity protein-like surface antigen